jgi:hypothetical protein
MKLSDILLVGLAAVGIYYIGKRFMNDAKLKNAIAQPSEDNDIISQPPPKSVTMVGTPNINGDVDIVKWVENQ